MKVNELVFKKMKSDLRIVLDYYKDLYGITFDNIEIPVSTYFNLWHSVYANKRYTNDNKNVNFVEGKRLFELDESFEYYPCDTNDDTLLTALRKAIKEIYNEKK